MKFVINNKTINIVDAPATGTTGQVLVANGDETTAWRDLYQYVITDDDNGVVSFSRQYISDIDIVDGNTTEY